MNNTIKISLTIELEGRTLVRKSEPEIIKYSIFEKGLLLINGGPKFNKKQNGLTIVKKGECKHYPLVIKPATQHINMTGEAYKYMISKECPYWEKSYTWTKMKPKQRLESHLKRICEHYKGKSFTYQILED